MRGTKAIFAINTFTKFRTSLFKAKTITVFPQTLRFFAFTFFPFLFC